MASRPGVLVPSRRLALILGETVVLLTVCFAITNYSEIVQLITRHRGSAPFVPPWRLMLIRGALLTLLCQVCFTLQDLYDWRVTSNPNQTSLKLLESVFYAGILIGLASYALTTGAALFGSPALKETAESLNQPWSSLAALVAVLPVAHFYRVFFHWVFARWQLNDRVLLVGAGSMARTLTEELRRLRDPGYEIIGFARCDPAEAASDDLPCLGTADQLSAVAQKHHANRVVVALDERRSKLPIIELLNCRLAGLRVEEAELLYERLTGKIAVQRLRPSYLVFAEGFTRGRITFAVKRALDVALAIVGLAILVPIGIVIGLVIKFESRGPVFYWQKRVGRDGRIFTCWKFRSMRSDAEKSGPQWAAKDDRRVTRFGRLLRRTRLDEFPQMWNVLRNEMSFVGPRPERPFFVDELRKQIPFYMERLLVKPGLTGWAQINYQYGSSVEDALTKLQHDLYYIKNLSIWLDLLILVRTIKVIVLRRGAV
jgi:sugar transferase (PEP-CTERM system associated)